MVDLTSIPEPMRQWVSDTIKTKDDRIAELESVLKELTDLMEDTITGEYTPDSFTTQPARAALAIRKEIT